ncbi:hypothetical protein BDP55DRAFT_48246 [Colletotrichum godetiae]|uniref:Uncharacterized protein n=1 Tax=Colletotrichum godetiae TaxID=1209918 RepID=A0AAJ0EYE4_9PEZI|nr:uncharacterized protein BDP55DRAFT_48246 [Colletotrichum godetiae]KAK1688556.1 hypothetical protein BDP55DRAFT_48246 [Colletotrichum godetiae]
MQQYYAPPSTRDDLLVEMQDSDCLQRQLVIATNCYYPTCLRHNSHRWPPTVIRRKNRRKTGWHDISLPHCLRPMSIIGPLIGSRFPQPSGTEPGGECNPSRRWSSNLHQQPPPCHHPFPSEAIQPVDQFLSVRVWAPAQLKPRRLSGIKQPHKQTCQPPTKSRCDTYFFSPDVAPNLAQNALIPPPPPPHV